MLRLINGITGYCSIEASASESQNVILWSGACPGAGLDAGLMGQRGANQVSIDTQYTHSAMVTHRPWGSQWSRQVLITFHLSHFMPSYLIISTHKPIKFPVRSSLISPKQRDPQKAGRISRDRDQIGYLHCLGDKNTENKNQIWSKHQGSTHKTANTNWLGIFLDLIVSSPRQKKRTKELHWF